MLEKEFNVEQANGGSFKELAIAKAIKAHSFPKNKPSVNNQLPSAEEDLTPSDMELRRKEVSKEV